jgi:hypothetical protein
MERSRRRILSTIGAASIGGAALSRLTTAADDPAVDVRFANLIADAGGSIDVFVNDLDVDFDDVSFGEITPYKQFSSLQGDITYLGSDSDLNDSIENPIDGKRYTVAAIPQPGSASSPLQGEIQSLVLQDEISSSKDTDPAVRVVHASPDAPAVDITTPDGTSIFSGLSFTDKSDTVNVPAGERTLQIRASADGSVVRETSVTLETGNTYTIFAVGYLTPEDEDDDDARPFQILPTVSERTVRECGDLETTGTVDGFLSFWNTGDSYTYTPQSEVPCSVAFEITAQDSLSFRVTEGDNTKTITADGTITYPAGQFSTSTEFDISIFDGSGRYELTVKERPRTDV